jgi:hypothetical protein
MIKYPGRTKTNKNEMHNEIRTIIRLRISCYFYSYVKTFFPPISHTFQNTEVRDIQTIILPVVLHGYGSALALREEHKLQALYLKTGHWEIFCPGRKKESGQFTSKEYSWSKRSPSCCYGSEINELMMEWTCSSDGDSRNVHRIF